MFGWFKKKYHYELAFSFFEENCKKPGYTDSTMTIPFHVDLWEDEVDLPDKMKFAENKLKLMGVKQNGLYVKSINRVRCYCERS